MAKRYLLDTHCLIWFQENNPKIPVKVMEIIQDMDNLIFFSQISLFEIAIKQSIGKLPEFKSDITEVLQQAVEDGLTFLQIQNPHLAKYNKIPLFEEHRDPFDRLLIATAYEEDATILTVDKNFKLYTGFINTYW